KLDERVGDAEALVLTELVDKSLRALGEQLLGEAEAKRQLDRREVPADRVGRYPQGRESFAERRQASRRGVPAIAERGHSPVSARAPATDPDRRVRLLHGLGRKADVSEAEERPVEGRLLRRPELLEHAKGLVGVTPARVERDPENLQLFLPPADA